MLNATQYVLRTEHINDQHNIVYELIQLIAIYYTANVVNSCGIIYVSWNSASASPDENEMCLAWANITGTFDTLTKLSMKTINIRSNLQRFGWSNAQNKFLWPKCNCNFSSFTLSKCYYYCIWCGKDECWFYCNCGDYYEWSLNSFDFDVLHIC